MKYSRRAFLTGLAGAAVGGLAPKRAEAAVGSMPDDSFATLYDLTKCDGCEGKDGGPRCVSSCRDTNAHKFPEPDKDKISDYWPQKKHEDWSGKRHVTNRLTPYNWTFVQSVTVDDKGESRTVHMPRRCMHCDNPPCVKLCPFGSNKKDKNGPVYIDPATCFGGAKCRTVCPWDVPQRQAGVGIYTYLQPLPVGGGVMYKCDLCRDRLAEGLAPACVESCPQKAIKFGRRADIFKLAEELKVKHDGHLYGMDENGGTSTVYVSDVPFESIDKAIVGEAKVKNSAITAQKDKKKPKKPFKPMRVHHPKSKLEQGSNYIWAALTAPVMGVIAGFALAARVGDKKNKGGSDDE